MSTANLFVQVLNIVISITLTQSEEFDVNAFLIVGICIVILGSAFYAFTKAYKPFLPAVDAALGCAEKREPPDKPTDAA